MHNELLIGLALVIVLSIAAQWIAWRIKLPSILLLLLFGIVAGPIANWINTDALLGELLFPLVSLSVAIILFEGGLTLNLDDLSEIGGVFRNLITIGALITWGMTAAAAHFLLGLNLPISVLLGAILVVTGPTVVIPLLNQIRPAGRTASILRWEGIAIDPVGAVLAVLVFEQIIAGETQIGTGLLGLLNTIIIGGTIGWVSARAMIEAFSRYLVPDHLHNPVVLTVIIGAFAISNLLQPESGLLTVTVMGIVMANQKRFDVIHIVEFKETLQILLISSLFILLGARLEISALFDIGGGVILFVLTLMLVIRPLAVWISAYKSTLNWKEKLFLSWMAPRGIVAASVASVFALALTDVHHEGAELLVPITFVVIITTVSIYGLTAGLLARWLGIAQDNPQGVLLLGAHGWAQRVAAHLQSAGFRVILCDVNVANVERALATGLEAYHGNILSEPVLDEISLTGIGNLLAVTPNDEVNSLASVRFKNIFGAAHVFQLTPQKENSEQSPSIGGRYLFGQNITYDHLTLRFNTGASINPVLVNDVESIEKKLEVLVPLFLITDNKELITWTAENPPALREGYTLIGLVDPIDEDILATQEMAFTPLPGVLTTTIADYLDRPAHEVDTEDNTTDDEGS